MVQSLKPSTSLAPRVPTESCMRGRKSRKDDIISPVLNQVSTTIASIVLITVSNPMHSTRRRYCPSPLVAQLSYAASSHPICYAPWTSNINTCKFCSAMAGTALVAIKTLGAPSPLARALRLPVTVSDTR
jgi:hypothetical protein